MTAGQFLPTWTSSQGSVGLLIPWRRGSKRWGVRLGLERVTVTLPLYPSDQAATEPRFKKKGHREQPFITTAIKTVIYVIIY